MAFGGFLRNFVPAFLVKDYFDKKARQVPQVEAQKVDDMGDGEAERRKKAAKNLFRTEGGMMGQEVGSVGIKETLFGN